jgi:lysophospholipase L1-like esterase
VVLGVLAVVVVVVVALVVWRRPDDDRTTVAVVGDSITERGEAVLGQELSSHWRLRVDGRSGYTVAEQLPAAEALAEGDPSQVVVNLGTNDVIQGHPAPRVDADLRELVGRFGAADCIHLVTINESMAVGGADLAAPAREVNQAIRTLASEDPRIDVVDWAGIVRDDEATGRSGGPLLSDTVHPTERGKVVLAQAYGTALESCAASPAR